MAAYLRELRQRALLTQEELAHRSGVSVATIASLENGRTRRPRQGSLRLLADALDLSDEQRALLVATTADRGSLVRPDTTARAEPDGVVSAQLPAALGVFTGRADDLKRLDELIDPLSPIKVTIATISGMAGVGKTTLAVHWARGVAHHFPDGQLYLNLRGFDRTGDPMTAHDAVRHLLGALTAMPDRVPESFEVLQGQFRSLLDGRRVLILLDNARDADQIRPLLPGGPGCLILVTSRNQLSGLVATDGAHPMELDVLSELEARDLLTARLGPQRIAAERHAVDIIIDRCARLPLALAVVAARAAIYPAFPLSSLAAALGSNRRSLDVLDGGDPATDARAVFSWSYQILSAEAAQLFRLLGVHGGPDFTARAAASLAGLPTPAVLALLAELTRAHLVTEQTPGRYVIHDLLRAFAAELVAAVDSESDTRLAAHRLLDHYLHSACAAERLLLHLCLNPIEPIPAQPTVTFERFTDRAHAMAWFETERRALVAAVRRASALGFRTHAWQLAWSLKTFLDWRGHSQELLETQELALTAATELADRPAQARVHRVLAFATFRHGRHGDALVHNATAMRIFADLDDTGGRARTHQDLAGLHQRMGAIDDALDQAVRAYELFELVGDRQGMARALNSAGWFHAHLGDHEAALACCERALDLLRDQPGHPDRAYTLDSIAFVHHQRGDLETAIGYYQQAIAGLRVLSDERALAEVLIRLGDAYHAAGHLDRAVDQWQQAKVILDEVGDPLAAQARERLSNQLATPDQ